MTDPIATEEAERALVAEIAATMLKSAGGYFPVKAHVFIDAIFNLLASQVAVLPDEAERESCSKHVAASIERQVKYYTTNPVGTVGKRVQ